MSISIFAKETFLNINPSQPFKDRIKPIPRGRGHLMRVSSLIRGDQITDQIGAKYNPTEGYENDTCIYVKPQVRKGDDFTFKGKKNYIDIVDGHNLAFVAQKHPEVGVITCSQADLELMTKELPNNEVVMIPQHHCNFDRIKRTRKKVKVVGCIGTRGAYDFLPKGLEKELGKRDMTLLFYSRFFSRQDIIDFYKKVDIQIVWRPYKKILSNPLKLVNAGSFGIPTIALDETAFKELKGHYIPVSNLDGFLSKLDELRTSKEVYQYYSEKLIHITEKKYHIEKIGELYKKLDE